MTLTLVGAASYFAAETYKETDRLNSRTLEDLSNQSATWETSLGHAISFQVRLDGSDGQTIPCDQRFEPVAFIDSGGYRLYGWTNGTFNTDPLDSAGCQGPAGVRTFNITFDLDGAPSAQLGSYPSVTGNQRATFEVYYAERPSTANPSGQGALAGRTFIDFSVLPLGVMLDKPVYRFPDSSLRGFTDTGGGVDALMPLTSYVPADTVEFGFDARTLAASGQAFDITAWRVLRSLSGIEPVAEPPSPLSSLDPISEKVTDVDERTATLVGSPMDISNVQPGEDGIHRASVPASQFQPTGVDHVPLTVVSMHAPVVYTDGGQIITGAATVTVPVQSHNFSVRDMRLGGINDPTASTQVTIVDQAQVSGGDTGADAGDLFAFRPVGFGFETIARGQLSRETGSSLITGDIDHMGFYTVEEGRPVLNGIASYRITGMIYGLDDGFLGMQSVQRGLELTAQPVRVVEDRPSNITVLLTSLTTDFDGDPAEETFAMSVSVTTSGLPGSSAQSNNTYTLIEGQNQPLSYPFTATTPGIYTATITARSGEILRTIDVPITIISREQYDEENSAWYDTPGPTPGIVTVALLGIIALVGRRRHA